MKYPGVIGGSYTSQSLIASAERTVNWYVEELEVENAANARALYPTPGFARFVGDTDGITDIGTRALWGGNAGGAVEQNFEVIGSGFYEVFQNRTVVRRGTVAADGNPAQIVYNSTAGGQLLVGSGGNAYCYTLATKAFTQVLTGDATMVAFLDERGLALDARTGIARFSDLNDFSSWPGANFFENSTTSDPWITMLVDRNRQVWFIGQKTGQVYYTTTDANNPYQPIPGSVFGWGIVGSFAGAIAGANLVWVSRNDDGAGVIVSARGYIPQKVSSFAVDTAVSGYARASRIDDAEILAYQDQGHIFANVSFPTARATWTVDMDRGSWHERDTWNAKQNRFDAWGPRAHCYAFGQHLVGDRSTGTIATMDVTLGSELDGSAIRRLRRAPALNQEHRRMRYDQLEILLEAGLGLAAGQGKVPTAMLRCSDDGGKTWSNEHIASAGRIGEYGARVYWNQLGVSADRVFELSVSDPTPWRIVDCYLNNLERYGRAAS